MTQYTSRLHFASFKKFQRQAASSLENRPSTLLMDAMSFIEEFETRNKAEEQTNSTSYQALSGHFFRKSLYTYKKLKNK
jgi:hypothetical protein